MVGRTWLSAVTGGDSLALSSVSIYAQQPLKSYKAAAIVYDPAWGDLDGNIARIAAAVDKAGAQGVKLAVLPEQATIGYIFDNFAMVRPYLDTVPGKTTDALAKVTERHHMYVAVGIAELDPVTGLGYNTAALVGPNGYIGKYRKHGSELAGPGMGHARRRRLSCLRYRAGPPDDADLLRRYLLAISAAGRVA